MEGSGEGGRDRGAMIAMTHDVPTPDRIMEVGHAFRASKTLLSAVELGVFTALASGPLDLKALSAQSQSRRARRP